jgi:hypothetical protein
MPYCRYHRLRHCVKPYLEQGRALSRRKYSVPSWAREKPSLSVLHLDLHLLLGKLAPDRRCVLLFATLKSRAAVEPVEQRNCSST